MKVSCTITTLLIGIIYCKYSQTQWKNLMSIKAPWPFVTDSEYEGVWAISEPSSMFFEAPSELRALEILQPYRAILSFPPTSL